MVPVVRTPVEGYTGSVVGVTFVDGEGETTNDSALEYFQRQGYEVVYDAPLFPEGVPAKAWKVDELKAYAAAHEVDLGEAKTKDEILAALTPAVTDPPMPVGDDGIPVLTDPANPAAPVSLEKATATE